MTISKSLNMNERKLLNEMQTIYFDKIISKPQNIHSKIYILCLLQHLKVSSKYIMASKSSHATQRDQIFNMTNFMGTPNCFSL
jgi:hypothetical protein